ncbi:MAG TPA: tetratricopeptide repeat protein [Gemmatimonadota bacterium]|nr:tetratricopeptide repeat protein [Gemmatimonadota bacterium]
MPAVGLISGGVVLFALFLPAHSHAQSSEARTWTERGDSLMSALDTGAAIEAYRRGLTARPDDPELLWKISRALSNRTAETTGREGDRPLHEEAAGFARRAVAAGPDIARTHTTLATVVGRYGRWLAHECRVRCARQVVDLGKEGYRATRRAIQLDPYDPAPFVVLGVYHRELSTVPLMVRILARTFLGGYPPVSLEQSVTYLDRAIRLEPDDVTAHLELARTYREMGRKAEAAAELRAALGGPVRDRLDAVEKEEAQALLDAAD